MKFKLNSTINKWNSYKNLIGLRLRSIVILLTMSFLASVSEILGLGIFYPIVEFIQAKEDISVLTSQSELWVMLTNLFALIGVKISLKVLLLSSFLLFTGRQLFLYVKVMYKAKLQCSLNKRLRNTLFKKYLYANSDYQDSLPIGGFSEVVARESSASVSGILNPIELISYIVMLIIFLSTLVLISWEMTVVAFIVLLVTSLIPRVWIQQSAITGREVVATNIELNSFLVNRLKSPRLVRLSGTENAEIGEFVVITERQREKLVEKARLANKTDMVMEPVVILLSLIFLYLSVTSLSMSLGLVGLYMVVALRLLPIIKGVIMQLQNIKSAMGSIEIVSKRFNEMSFNKETDEGEINVFNIQNFIEFNSVHFHYPINSKYVLNDITFKIPMGKITAIVGPSGSGKSTLIDLLPRLRSVLSGNIYFDNISINKFSLDSLRGMIAYASQNPQIFNVTIERHIRYGKPDATMDEVIHAAILSGLSEFIETLPLGYNTLLGEGSIRLSGGQQQKLDLARVLISKPQILILDEPTSNLDPESEKEFEKTLYSIKDRMNITVLIVTHHLGIVANADQIVELNQGDIESVGKHVNLINSDGWYKKAWNSQNRLT